jgi:hypothetical protein
MTKPRTKLYVPYLGMILDPNSLFNTNKYTHRKDLAADTAVRSNKYTRTELYLDKDGILYNLVDDITSDELYIPINSTELLQYQEHLDGPVLRKDEAVSKYPEMFI